MMFSFFKLIEDQMELSFSTPIMFKRINLDVHLCYIIYPVSFKHFSGSSFFFFFLCAKNPSWFSSDRKLCWAVSYTKHNSRSFCTPFYTPCTLILYRLADSFNDTMYKEQSNEKYPLFRNRGRKNQSIICNIHKILYVNNGIRIYEKISYEF